MPTITFSGLASGIDSDAVIKALTDAKRIQTLPLENQINEANQENDALDEFNTRMLALQDSLKDFMSLAGGAISKTANSSNEDAVSASATNAAVTSSTTLDVTSLAKSATFSFNDRLADATVPLAPGLSAPANIDITLGTGASASTYQVEMTSSTTLDELAVAINEETEGKAVASVINTGTDNDPQYTLMLNGQTTGLEEGALSVSVDPAITNAGIFQASTLDQAQNAVFTISGVGEFTRSTNEVSGIIQGLTLELKQEGAGPVTINVGNDADKTAEKLQSVVDAFNAIVEHSSENSTVEREDDTDGASHVYGSLARTRLDERAIDSLRNALANAASDISGSEVQIFADLGVTTERDGTLAFDQDKFKEGVGKDAVAANKVINGFADTLAKTSGLIEDYTKYQGQIDLSQEGNESSIESLNDRIERIERSIEQQEETMRRVFANLESTIGKLNSQSNALMSVIASGFGAG